MIEYREMVPGDYAQCYAVWQRVPGMNLRTDDDSEVEIRRVMDANPHLCWVALADGAIVGTVIGASDGRRGTIYHLAVQPNYQHQGIAKALVSRVVTGLKAMGIRKIRVFVVNDNVAGRHFWKDQGLAIREDVRYMDAIL